MQLENCRLQFRFEAVNFTHTAHFGRPNTTAGTIEAGQTTLADFRASSSSL